MTFGTLNGEHDGERSISADTFPGWTEGIERYCVHMNRMNASESEDPDPTSTLAACDHVRGPVTAMHVSN